MGGEAAAKPKPSKAGSVWGGGARKRPEFLPAGKTEGSGLCDDEAMLDNALTMKLGV